MVGGSHVLASTEPAYALTLIGMYTLATLALSALRRDDLSVLLDVD